MKISLSKKIETLLFIFLLVFGFLIRLYKLNNPIADWHSWRQADTSAVSRNFVNGGFNLLYPKFDDLSNVPSGIYDNPQGYRFVEFPIFNVFQAVGFLLFPKLTLEEWGRLIAIFSSLASAAFIYLLVKKYANKSAGFFAMFFFLFLPFSIYYSRTILPDEMMVTTTLAAIYFSALFFETSSSQSKKIALFLLSGLFFALAMLLKPFAVFFFVPSLLLAWQKWKLKIFSRVELWALLFIAFAPFIFWRIWMSAHPEGIPQSNWLFNGGNIRFTGAYFRWIFAIRISELILGFWGLPVLILGIVAKQKNKIIFYSFIIASLLYLIVVARGNVQHDYYQILIIPTVAMLLGVGSNFLLHPHPDFVSKYVSRVTLAVALLFMLAFSWFEVRDYYNINNPAIITAGLAVDALTPKNAKIIAPYNGDTSLLYQTKRKGWASFEKPVTQLIKMGADFLVLVNPSKQDLNIGKTYKIIASTPDYLIFDLHKSP